MRAEASPSPRVSVVVCSYNRSESLSRALKAMVDQAEGGPPFEIVVVNNNSTDSTHDFLQAFCASHPTVRYVFERKQGLSHARNAGIAASAAPLIAFTDDDVVLSRDWVAVIASAFDRRPDIEYVGGKVLPHWPKEPPRWLSREHWSPLALLDAGEEPIELGPSRRKHVVGANFAFRRTVFERVGGFATNVQRVKDGIGSTEDHEFQLRCWEAGITGLYIPELVVWADVQAERLEKPYHRRWYAGHGAYSVVMGAIPTSPDGITLFGTPMYHYVHTLRGMTAWVRCCVSQGESQRFAQELQCREAFGVIRKYFSLHRATTSRSLASEVARWSVSLLRKQWRPS